MSFCNSNSFGSNSPHGVCEKVCLQVKKVFDACMSQTSIENQEITIVEFSTGTPNTPLTFVSATSTSSVGVIKSYTFTSLAEKPGFSRVQATIQIPVEVSFIDAKNVAGKGTGYYTVQKDVVMCMPESSVVPVELASTVNLASTTGTYVSGNKFSINACVTVVLKLEAEVDILVPSYGYCKIPLCQDYTEEVCAGVFDLPLFPRTPSSQ